MRWHRHRKELRLDCCCDVRDSCAIARAFWSSTTMPGCGVTPLSSSLSPLMQCQQLAILSPHLGLARREREAQRGVESRGEFTTPMSSGVVIGDLSIVPPAAPSFVAAAATTMGAAARSRDASKCAHYTRRGLSGEYELVRSLWSPSGAWGRRRTPCCAASPTWPPTAAFIVGAPQEMGVTLAKGNGRVLRAHLSRVAQASGRAYLRGLPVPVAAVVGLEG
jgi:hypothetical protein